MSIEEGLRARLEPRAALRFEGGEPRIKFRIEGRAEWTTEGCVLPRVHPTYAGRSWRFASHALNFASRNTDQC